MSPWIAWAVTGSAGILLQELFGSAIAGASPSSLPLAWLEHARNLLLLGGPVILGFRPAVGHPLAGTSLCSPSRWPSGRACSCTLPVVLRRRDAELPGRWIIAGVAVTTLAGFILTSFGADPSGRYFLPVAMPMAVFAGSMVADLRARADQPLARRARRAPACLPCLGDHRQRVPKSARPDDAVRSGGPGRHPGLWRPGGVPRGA